MQGNDRLLEASPPRNQTLCRQKREKGGEKDGHPPGVETAEKTDSSIDEDGAKKIEGKNQAQTPFGNQGKNVLSERGSLASEGGGGRLSEPKKSWPEPGRRVFDLKNSRPSGQSQGGRAFGAGGEKTELHGGGKKPQQGRRRSIREGGVFVLCRQRWESLLKTVSPTCSEKKRQKLGGGGP